jgi:hypothetical protein
MQHRLINARALRLKIGEQMKRTAESTEGRLHGCYPDSARNKCHGIAARLLQDQMLRALRYFLYYSMPGAEALLLAKDTRLSLLASIAALHQSLQFF